MVDLIPSYILALLALCVPIWAITESVSAAIEAAGYKATLAGQLVLRLLPSALGVAVCLLAPDLLVWLMARVGYEPQTPPSVGTLIVGGLVAGWAAVQLHQWGLPQIVRGMLGKVLGAPPTALLLVALVAGVLAGASGCGTATYTGSTLGWQGRLSAPSRATLIVDGKARCTATCPTCPLVVRLPPGSTVAPDGTVTGPAGETRP